MILLTPNERDFFKVCLLSANFGRFRWDSSPISVDLLILLFGPLLPMRGDSENLAKGLSNCKSKKSKYIPLYFVYLNSRSNFAFREN